MDSQRQESAISAPCRLSPASALTCAQAYDTLKRSDNAQQCTLTMLAVFSYVKCFSVTSVTILQCQCQCQCQCHPIEIRAGVSIAQMFRLPKEVFEYKCLR